MKLVQFQTIQAGDYVVIWALDDEGNLFEGSIPDSLYALPDWNGMLDWRRIIGPYQLPKGAPK